MSSVRVLAQTDPVPNLAGQLGAAISQAHRDVERLTSTLRELDKLTTTLAEHGIVVDVELGPVGDAARAARRDIEKPQAATFTLPR